jgi:hypothetical protein
VWRKLLQRLRVHLRFREAFAGYTPELERAVLGRWEDAIYLHVLWVEGEAEIFYLYVGQSTEAELRIEHHNDPKWRKGHPSQHYYVWEKLGPNVRSAWVMLSAPNLSVIAVDPLSLDLLDMWSSLFLQTLPKSTLPQFLPSDWLSPRAGCHLNVASPLHQRVRSDGLSRVLLLLRTRCVSWYLISHDEAACLSSL